MEYENSQAVRELAEELPEYQTSRGMEFREIPPEQRENLANVLVRARSQANATHADWRDDSYRREMRRKQNEYYYEVGQLGIDMKEAYEIWWGVVHGDSAPIEQRTQGLI